MAARELTASLPVAAGTGRAGAKAKNVKRYVIYKTTFHKI